MSTHIAYGSIKIEVVYIQNTIPNHYEIEMETPSQNNKEHTVFKADKI